MIDLARLHPALAAELRAKRPLLAHLDAGRDALEVELDAERRSLMRANEARLQRYLEAGARWAEAWVPLVRELEQLPLTGAHERMVRAADGVLPFRVAGVEA